MLPLLLSIVVAYAVSLVLGIAAKAAVRWTDTHQAAARLRLRERGRRRRGVPGAISRARRLRDEPYRPDITVLHWISSGATGCARGLNDTPKIAAIGGFALVPAGYSATAVSVLVVAAMAAGSLAAIRVARTLGEKVLKMSHVEGLAANLTTAGLVGSGALLAMPMSTTQVSTGAIVGAAGGQLSRLSGRTLRDFGIAWLITPVFGALVAGLA